MTTPRVRWSAIVLPCIVTVGFVAGAHAEPWKRHTIDDSSRGADGVRLADANGDGLPDIATGWEEGGVIRAYLNPGTAKAGSRWPAVTVGNVKSPEDAVMADLDGDGAMDVVSSCEGNNRTVFIHWAPTDKEKYLDAAAWTTEPFPTTQGVQMWMYALPMNVDDRNGIDLIVGSKGSGATIGWLQSPKNPREMSEWTFHPLYSAGWIMSLEAHDMDGDGDLDVLASDRKGSKHGVLWLENPGPKAAAAGAKWNEHRIGPTDRQVMFLTTGDLDGDGLRDIVCAVSGGSILFLRATGDAGKAWQVHDIPMPPNCGTGKGVAVGDIDGDGKNDVVFTCENAIGNRSGVRWLAYQKTGAGFTWTDHEISGAAGVKFDRVELLDLDGDGDLDVLTCAERENLGVFWYENPTR
jgi:hypothetical protein